MSAVKIRKGALITLFPVSNLKNIAGRRLIGYGEIIKDDGETISVSRPAGDEKWDRKHIIVMDSLKAAEEAFCKSILSQDT